MLLLTNNGRQLYLFSFSIWNLKLHQIDTYYLLLI